MTSQLCAAELVTSQLCAAEIVISQLCMTEFVTSQPSVAELVMSQLFVTELVTSQMCAAELVTSQLSATELVMSQQGLLTASQQTGRFVFLYGFTLYISGPVQVYNVCINQTAELILFESMEDTQQWLIKSRHMIKLCLMGLFQRKMRPAPKVF